MNNNRCQYIVTSKNIREQLYNRKCRNTYCSSINLNTKKCNKFNYCFIHINKLYKNYVNTIIRHFRGYYIRKKIYYYKLLPCDVQYKIIYKMRENFYIDHYNCSISKILYNKVKSFNKEIKDSTITKENLTDLFIKSLFFEISFQDEWAINITDKLFDLLKLLNKYKLIISKKTVKILDYLVHCSSTVNMYYSSLSYFHFSNFQDKLQTIIEFYKNYNDLKLP